MDGNAKVETAVLKDFYTNDSIDTSILNVVGKTIHHTCRMFALHLIKSDKFLKIVK